MGCGSSMTTGPDSSVADIIAAAQAARSHAYAPYSRFAVGAALRLTDGTIITGSNMENASYGLSLCAEAVAIATANSTGRLADIEAIAIVGGLIEQNIGPAAHNLVTPCGRCRQILAEAETLSGRQIIVTCATIDGNAWASYSVEQLLPHSFGQAALITGEK